MLGPSFSPSIARIPGPISSHSSCQRLRWLRASWTRARSTERTVSSPVRRGSPRPAVLLASVTAIGLVTRRQRATGLELDAHRAREPTADRLLAPAEVEKQRPAERLARADDEAVAGGDAALAEVAQHRRIGVRDAHESAAVTGLERLEAACRALVELEVGGRDRVAVWVGRRVAELLRDQRLELL